MAQTFLLRGQQGKDFFLFFYVQKCVPTMYLLNAIPIIEWTTKKPFFIGFRNATGFQ